MTAPHRVAARMLSAFFEDARMASWWLVLNGKAALREDVRAAVARARARVDVRVRVTWEAGDAARHVEEAIAAGADTIVAGGGDGTLGEVAGALAAREADADALPAIGVLPLGTANDFATAAQLPMEADDAFALIRAQPPVPVDLLRVDAGEATEARWCVNLASGGFGTQVTVETDDGLKKMLGGLAYLITGIAKLGRIEAVRARLVGDGFEWSGGFIALGVGNARQAGGGQALCPDASIDDARLDLTVIPELAGDVGATVRTLLTEGREAALDRVAVRARLPWVHLEAEWPLTLNLDGEPVTARRFRIECVPRRVRMHLPPGCPLLGPPGTPLPADAPSAGRDPEAPPAALPA